MRKLTEAVRLALLSGTIATLLCAGPAMQAQTQTVWKIGTFNYSSREFRGHQDVDYADPSSDLTFTIGKNKDSDWYRFQPGTANGMTGGRTHPITLKFTLAQKPTGTYRLRIGMLYETPRLSYLHLKVNGHSGNFYFHPRLDFHAGDWEGTFVPQTSYDLKEIEIPTGYLKQGENTLVLTALDDPATSQVALGAIAPGHTGLVYDALELKNDGNDNSSATELSAQIIPSIFYKNSANGLAEVVDVYVSAPSWETGSPVELRVGDATYSSRVTADTEFGEQHLIFEVPEWMGDAQATVVAGSKSSKAVPITAAKKWNLAIIPHEHLDVGFTDYPAKVAELHSQSIDEAMKLIEKTPDFRWTLDGSWVAEQYLAGRNAKAQEQFMDHVRKGSIVIPPEYSNQHTGNASWEALARSLYGARALQKRFDLPRSTAAQIVDVPSYTWAYASVLHDAGIKYLVAASNSWRAPIMLHGQWNTKSPFYWEGPDGSRILMWYSRAYLQGHTLFGGPWSMEAVRDSLPVFLQAYTRPDYTANTAIIFGTQLENTPLAKEQSHLVAEFSKQFAFPTLEYSTVQRAMRRVESEWKGEFPVYRGDFGPYWEDGYGSEAHYTAIHRENQHRIATAEVMGAAATTLDPLVHPDRSTIGDAWRNELVFDEHTWTYVGATTQPEHKQTELQLELKGSRAIAARNEITESIQRSWAQLEAILKPKENSLAVFNSLSWARDGLVEADIPAETKLVNAATGEDVPLEVLYKGKGIALPGFGPGNLRVRFMATNVPAVGYRLYQIKASKTAPQQDVRTTGNVIENSYYRITIDAPSGAIASIFDKQLNRELTDRQNPHKFGAYLYVTGGDDYPANSLYRFGESLKPPALTIHAASAGKLVSVKRSAIGSTITLTSSAPNTPSVITEILLPNAEKKILLTYRINKQRVLNRESAYIAFPFAVSRPEFAYGSQTAWVDPAKNELAGGSREWYLPTTWASVHNEQWSAAVVPLDAPLMTFGDIVRANWPTEFKPASSSMYSWLMNNYWGTNFSPWQGGEYVFRYAITSAPKFDPASLTRFGWNSLTPLEHDDVSASTDRSVLPASEATLLNVDDPNVSLLTWKVAEDGDGTIVRLQEHAGRPAKLSLTSKFVVFKEAWLCDALEEKTSAIQNTADEVAVEIKPFQVVTLRIRTEPRREGRL